MATEADTLRAVMDAIEAHVAECWPESGILTGAVIAWESAADEGVWQNGYFTVPATVSPATARGLLATAEDDMRVFDEPEDEDGD